MNPPTDTPSEHPDTDAPQPRSAEHCSASPSPDAAAATPRLTREGLTIFQRYGPGGAWYHKFTHGRRQHMVKLAATVQDSFKLAKKIRADLRAGRIERALGVMDALRERRPSSPLAAIFAHYLSHAPAATGISPATCRANIQAARRLLREGRPGTPGTPSDMVAVRKDPVDTMPADHWNAAACEAYKRRLLETAGDDRLAQDRAKITINSTLRMSRSLFAKKLPRDFYQDFIIPNVEELNQVRLLPETGKTYTPVTASLVNTIRAAAPALKTEDPNGYLIYLLSFVCGLRKSEIAAARRHWIEPSPCAPGQYQLHIQTETDFRPKSKQDRTVPLPAIIRAELEELAIPVLPGSGQPAYLLRGTPTERRDASFRRFGAWLVSHGWDRKKKAHEFRKLCGSYVAQQAGMRAAQEILGHAQYSTTEKYYVGQLTPPQYTIPALG